MHLGAFAVLVSLMSQNIGASYAKQLFPVVSPDGVSALRIGLAALLLLALQRPWRRRLEFTSPGVLILYGVSLAVMNITIYHAFARIPLGIAVAIEILGPLAVVLWSSRRALDYLWLGMATLGLFLLLPIATDAYLDPLGVAASLLAGLCWAMYIVFGKRLSAAGGSNMVAWGLLVAAVLAVPYGTAQAGAALLDTHILLAGLAVAVLSSAVPYSLEMFALSRLPRHVFGLLLSSAPAVAALAGFLVLGERLAWLQWAAIALVMMASFGSTLSASRSDA